MDFLKRVDKKATGLFAAGILFGTAGIKILSSKDAKKVYTHCTAAVLRAKECVMNIVANAQENAEDIYVCETDIAGVMTALPALGLASAAVFQIAADQFRVQSLFVFTFHQNTLHPMYVFTMIG